MSQAEQNELCVQISGLLMFYVCDEVNEQERAAIQSHLADCPVCREQLSKERDFQEAIDRFAHQADQACVADILLSQCRSELAEKLDDLERPVTKEKVSAVGWLRAWMLMRPVWSAATLVLLGLVVGTQYSQWSGAHRDNNSPGGSVSVRPDTRLTDDQLSKMAVAGINITPSPYSGSQNVRVRLNSEQPIELDGNVDDSNVRNVLTFVVANGERFDSGVRLDCLDALRTRAADSSVRAALLTAARKDQNPAVRLKALEALHDSGIDSTVRETLLDALQHDSNPGVRVEAVNLLVRSLEEAQTESVTPPPQQAQEMPSTPVIQASTHSSANTGSIQDVIRALETLQHNDSSRYVRLRSATALREIGARNDQ
ncbi:MAG: HEAT repeat domain-containing protein [Candidatus Acidiferrum sp.]